MTVMHAPSYELTIIFFSRLILRVIISISPPVPAKLRCEVRRLASHALAARLRFNSGRRAKIFPLIAVKESKCGASVVEVKGSKVGGVDLVCQFLKASCDAVVGNRRVFGEIENLESRQRFEFDAVGHHERPLIRDQIASQVNVLQAPLVRKQGRERAHINVP